MENLLRHRDLIERQANVHHMQETTLEIQAAKVHREKAQAAFDSIRKAEQNSRYLTIINWLSAADILLDHESFIDKRREYPETGKWILDNPTFKAWHDSRNSLTPMLWLHWMPGAGIFSITSTLV